MNLTKDLRGEYKQLWTSCAIRSERIELVDQLVDRVVKNRKRYEAAARPAGVPWHVVGVIHLLESSGNFGTHLHNGDPLSARTVRVPAGRPATGRAPFTWEQSAADALVQQGLNAWRDWSVPGTLYVLERYNGFGYRPRGINSPYLWSFSNQYTKGKYVADGKFSASAVSEQCGAAVLLSRMVERGLTKLGAPRRNGAAPPVDDGILRRGAKSPAVRALKKQLRAWFEKASPGEWETFGVADNDVFGTGFAKAVRVFQARAGIEVDGEIGDQTRGALAAKPSKVKAVRFKDLAFSAPIKNGNKSLTARLVQSWLSLNGFHVAVDGEFGGTTEEVVTAFQTKRGLPPTGVVDEPTWAALTAPMRAALRPIPKVQRLGPLVVAYAKQHLKRHPLEIGGPNTGPWVRLYTDGKEGKDFPWCAGFASFVVKQAADTLGVAAPFPRTLACDVMAANAGSRFVPGSAPGAQARVRPGSIFLQLARANERRLFKYRHTGIVVSPGPTSMATIEGNTNDDGSADGFEVCARTRTYAEMDFIVL
jgi:lysozyme family protein/peptidoglycan hydrolase-like protein with peptidoglycan-binding domain